MAIGSGPGRMTPLPPAPVQRLPFADRLGPVRDGMRAVVTSGTGTALQACINNFLAAYADFSWYDWPTQLRSLDRLRRESFSWVLAGHGGSIHLSEEEMQSKLDTMLSRYRS